MAKILSALLSKSIGCYVNLLRYVSPAKATNLAYRFFTHPRAGKLTEGQIPAILTQAKQETVSHNGQTFQIYVWPGAGPVVLLVHGWESNASRWELLIEYLRRADAKIIALDAPAHGRSSGIEFTMPKYAEVMDVVARKYNPTHLIGHSLGGATSMYYQATYQNPHLQKMVILGAPCDMETLLVNYRGILGLSAGVMELLQKHFLDVHHLNTVDFSCRKFAAAITVKALIAHDLEDEVVSYKEARKIAEAWPDAEFVTTRGLGHSLHAKELYERIYNFLFEEELAHK